MHVKCPAFNPEHTHTHTRTQVCIRVCARTYCSLLEALLCGFSMPVTLTLLNSAALSSQSHQPFTTSLILCRLTSSAQFHQLRLKSTHTRIPAAASGVPCWLFPLFHTPSYTRKFLNSLSNTSKIFSLPKEKRLKLLSLEIKTAVNQCLSFPYFLLTPSKPLGLFFSHTLSLPQHLGLT